MRRHRIPPETPAGRVPDPRSAAQRRADAFVQVVEAASRALGDGGLVALARTEILLTVPATTTAVTDTCCGITPVGSGASAVDGQRVR